MDWLHDPLWTHNLLPLLDRVLLALNPAKRLYAPFLLGALLLAVAVWGLTLRKRVSLFGYLFPKAIWLHGSTWLDVRLALVRAVLEGLLVAPFVIPVTSGALWLAQLGWDHVAIVPTVLDLQRPAVTALFSLAVFAAEDLGRFTIHQLAHRLPVLWELHKVHHSAEVLTPLTVYRTHPIESLVMRTGAALAIILTAGLFVWLFPGKVGAWEIGGVYALSFLWNTAGSNLRHSHVWLRYPAWLQRWLLCPAQHQLHHSTEPHWHHSNYGSALAIWDRLAGSLQVAGERPATLTFGLPPQLANHRQAVWSVLWHPLVAALRRLRRTTAGERVRTS